MQSESPVNPIPSVVIVLCLIMVGVEGMFSLGEAGIIGGPRAIGWRLAALQDYGFSPAVLEQVMQRGDYSFDMLKRFVTHPFVNQTFTQALFAAALLLALGKFVGDAFGSVRALAVFVISSIAGALVFGLALDGTVALFGGFTPVYGLIGAYTFALWLRLGRAGESQMRAFRLIGFILGIQLVFGLIFGASLVWIAELSAFFVGLAVSVLLVPGGWTAFVHRMRQRT